MTRRVPTGQEPSGPARRFPLDDQARILSPSRQSEDNFPSSRTPRQTRPSLARGTQLPASSRPHRRRNGPLLPRLHVAIPLRPVYDLPLLSRHLQASQESRISPASRRLLRIPFHLLGGHSVGLFRRSRNHAEREDGRRARGDGSWIRVQGLLDDPSFDMVHDAGTGGTCRRTQVVAARAWFLSAVLCERNR